MNWLEVALLVFGVGAFAGSFLIREKTRERDEGQTIDPELIRSVIDKEMQDAKVRVTEVVDETLEYAVEKTERASERISNEKIMAISEYSETVLADINKSHQEVMFLYDMLNDKHNNLKETVKHVDKTAKEAEEAANAAAIALAAKAKEEAEAKEREKQEEANRNKLAESVSLDKDAQEKEYARRQMARLILPMQQEMTMHRQMDARALDMTSWALNAGNRTQEEKPAELRPLVVKIPWISLVNLNLGREAVREVVESRPTGERLERELRPLLEGGAERARMLRDFDELRAIIGPAGASDRVAKDMVETLRGRQADK